MTGTFPLCQIHDETPPVTLFRDETRALEVMGGAAYLGPDGRFMVKLDLNVTHYGSPAMTTWYASGVYTRTGEEDLEFHSPHADLEGMLGTTFPTRNGRVLLIQFPLTIDDYAHGPWGYMFQK